MRVLAFFLLPVLGCAAEPAAGIEALIGQARAAPPELASSVLLRLAALPQLDKPLRIALLAEAFDTAAGARRKYKRRAADAARSAAGRYTNQVESQDLDGLSLRLRAVEELLPLDARKARDLFLRIAPLSPPPATCQDYLVYDVDRFYDVLGSVARVAFNAEEIRKGEPVRMLAQFAGAIDSPVRIAPAARMIASAGLGNADFLKVLEPFAGALRLIAGDDRSFTYARAAGAEIGLLVAECQRREISPLMIAEAYRAYLVNNLSGARCADSATDSLFRPGNPANYFNSKLAVPPVRPIEERETKPLKAEGGADEPRSCQSRECQAIEAQFRGLIFAPTGEPWTAERKSAPEWKLRFDEFLSAMSAWQQGQGQEGPTFFREKSAIYKELFGVTSDQAHRESVARAALEFFAASRYRAEDAAEWLLPVSALIGRARLERASLGWLSKAMESSTDPVIALFARLEEAAPRAPSEILPLF